MSIKKLNLEERIEKSGLFYYDDGYCGSTNHCVNYYYGYSEEDIKNMVKDKLVNIILDKDNYYNGSELCDWGVKDIDGVEWEEKYGEDNNDIELFFDKWFGGYNKEFELIENSISYNKYGYGLIELDKVKRSIKISVVPVLYGDDWDEKMVYGFDDNGELVKLLSDKEIDELISKGYSY